MSAAPSEPPLDSPLLLRGATVATLPAAWAVAWLAVHFLCRPGKRAGVHSRTNVGRIRRSQVYCGLAVLGGARLLLRGATSPSDRLPDFGTEHQVLFSMAAGHWAVALWEAARCRALLAHSISRRKLGVLQRPGRLLQIYFLHHSLAAVGYACLVLLRGCTVLGACGLLSELPQLLLNARELALHEEGPPAWLRARVDVQRYWLWAYSLFVLVRWGFCCAYICSILFWRNQLDALGKLEKLLYHSTALAFGAVNCGFVGVMDASYCHDVEAARSFGDRGGDAEDAEAGRGGDEERGLATPRDPSAAPPKPVTPEVLASKIGTGPDSSVWLAVDGAAYDITRLLPEHPGGDQVLRKWGGRDASEAFHRAGHSREAMAMMARYLVGPVSRMPTRYRIFEHAEAESAVAATISALACSYLAKAAALCWLVWVQPATAAAAEPEFLDLCLMGLLVVAASGQVAGALAWCVQTEARSCTGGARALSLCLLAYQAAMFVVCQQSASAAEPAWDSALELAAGLVLLAEGWLSPSTGSSWDRRLCALVGLIMVIWSWKFRAEAAWSASPLQSLPLARSLGLGRPVLSALAVGASIPLLCRSLGRGGLCSSAEEAMALVASALRLSGIYSTLGLVVLVTCAPAAQHRLTSILAPPAPLIAGLLTTAVANTAALCCLAKAAARTSPAFAARAVGFLLAAIGVFAHGWDQYRWLSASGFLWYLAELAFCNRMRLAAAGDAGRFGELPPHVIGAQALWDRARFVLASTLWRLTVVKGQILANISMPRETRVYACEAPLPSLGHTAHWGVAAHFAPPAPRGQAQAPPRYFVCNVGQIIQSCIGDMQKTLNNLLDVWKEFEEPTMKGLVANMIAVFPSVTNQGLCKEINLSAWESSQDAYEWYIRSPGHKTALLMHSSGLLRTFGNLLASLEPSQALRHQDRCRQCARPVDATEAGARAPSRCTVCGAQTFGHPVF